MSNLYAAVKPLLTSGTIFFVGNGVLRVAPGLAPDRHGRQFLSPSWSEYMDSLWSFAGTTRESRSYLSLADFSQLPAPRQAEWFDREFREAKGTRIDTAVLRLHLLGRVLHPNSLILANPLFQQIAKLIVGSPRDSAADQIYIDVMTTNVDCGLEQNIAWAIENLLEIGRPPTSHPETGSPPRTVRRATIEAIVDFRLSARWEMSAGGSGQELRIRLWKLHGCLRDLKIQLSRDAGMAQAVLSLTGDTEIGICGRAPTDELASNLSARWRQTHHPERHSHPYRGVFSQSEYFRNLLMLARGEIGAERGSQPHLASHDEQLRSMAEFRELLACRSLIFVGYSIPEVDVDIVYALQQYRQRDGGTKRWQLLAHRDCSATADERLRQMGVDPWPFEVSSIGFAAIPGKLRAARRHEWRLRSADPLALAPDKDWRRALEGVAGHAWLEPQLASLRSLTQAGSQGAAVPSAVGQHRLVVAGLASIWHGIALTKSADFPVPRRVSAQLISVDGQVPGGSGLVPVMVAAAAAGPAAVGSVTFFSNAPREWSSWDEIEDMCLSAGVAVYPWRPEPGANSDGLASVARTSHVILFDSGRQDAGSRLPRQRFIMDVQALANEELSPRVADWSKLRVPPASPLVAFQKSGQEDFLFTDKESDPQVIANWQGPTVYETGASGDELVTRLKRIGARPTIWTAGVGSFIRTMVALADRVPSEGAYAGGPQAVLRHIEEDPRLAVFAQCDDLRERYLAKVISFGRKGIWDFGTNEGFTHPDELDYGVWLRDRWAKLAGPAWDILRTGGGSVLAEPHPRIGGGVLTTIHDGGLMALWRWRDGRTEHVVVRIATSMRDETQVDEAQADIVVRCEVDCAAGQQLIEQIQIRVSCDQLTLAVGALEQDLGPSAPIRRNTLAAGDTVRGAMAYGLWSAAYQMEPEKPVDIRRIFLASAALASLKCYAGSFVDFLKLLEGLRGTPAWRSIWAPD